MNVVKHIEINDGAEIDNRYCIYCSHFEFSSILTALRVLAIPYSTEVNDLLEEYRRTLIATLPASVNRKLELLCDEMHKSL